MSATFNSATLELTTDSRRWIEVNAAANIYPVNDDELSACHLADKIGLIVTAHGQATLNEACQKEIKLYLPGLQDGVTTHGKASFFKMVEHMPIMVDTAAFVERQGDVEAMCKAETRDDQQRPQARLNFQGNQAGHDRSLDHLIYDGMGQIRADGSVLGNVRR